MISGPRFGWVLKTGFILMDDTIEYINYNERYRESRSLT